MVQKGGLGRGLMSLIPQTKSTSQAKNRTSRSKNKTGRSNRRKNLIGVGNHFGAEAVYEKRIVFLPPLVFLAGQVGEKIKQLQLKSLKPPPTK